MHEHDPMKDNSGTNGNHRVGGDGYGPADRGYTYGGAGDGSGTTYTTPDGSHGYVYNDPRGGNVNRSRSFRGAFIAVTVVLVTVLLGSFCLLGAYMATKNLVREEGEGDSAPKETGSEVSTSNGLYIDDGTDSAQSGEEKFPSETESSGTKPPHAGGMSASDETLPPVASIDKVAPEREDKDGDGRPDVVYGEDGEVLTSAGSAVYSVATVVSRVADSVVEITTETLVQSGFIGQYVTGGAGSGVIVSPEGFIVTNHHVIDGANTIVVRLTDGTEYPATLVGSDEQTDVAVLWIDAGERELTVATLGSSYDLVVGEDVIAIGNPMGSLGGTVTEGMVSATARDINVGGMDMRLLQVSAPINPGNSGGGLFNLAGELVGVVNAKVSSAEIEGLGFAIPVDTAYAVIVELIDHGYVSGRPALDFDTVDVTSTQTAMRYFNSFYTGVYVYDEDHPEVMYGDLILAVNGKEVSSCAEISSIIADKKVGDTVELTVYRHKGQHTVTVTLVEHIPEPEEPAA